MVNFEALDQLPPSEVSDTILAEQNRALHTAPSRTSFCAASRFTLRTIMIALHTAHSLALHTVHPRASHCALLRFTLRIIALHTALHATLATHGTGNATLQVQAISFNSSPPMPLHYVSPHQSRFSSTLDRRLNTPLGCMINSHDRTA